MALDVLDEFPENEIFIIPVRLDDCEPIHERLRNLHRVDLFRSYEHSLKKIRRVFETLEEASNKESHGMGEISTRLDRDVIISKKSSYDMPGNVWELVEDDWHADYKNATDDGSAWVDKPRGLNRVLRGGGWNLDARICRSAFRLRFDTNFRLVLIGFRLATLPGQLGEPDKSSL